MESVVERITRKHFWKFHGGIHPPEQKFITNHKPIRHLPLPAQLIIPLQQHIGAAAELIVKAGDYVLKGQSLTASQHPMAVPIHAPTSGTIKAIKLAPIAHPSATQEPCIWLTPDGLDKWRERIIREDILQLTREQLLDIIAEAGIAGMGGAGFPTYIKISHQTPIEFLIINAAECEPYITADDLLMREHSSMIVEGIKILQQIVQAKYILIGIEDNKPEAIQALTQATAQLADCYLCVLPTKYPTGGEKQLIQILTGKEIAKGTLPVHAGIIMQNIATCFAIANAVLDDVPLIQRIVTVTGQALDKPQNVWALLGTPIQHLLDQCGYQAENNNQLIMGGPMMGFSLPTTQIPVVKTTNCIIAPTEQEIPSGNHEVECIRCGQCAEVCPSLLLPQELQWSAKANDLPQLEKLNLFDCIECGACAYVCPSQIPLVHYYRVAKVDIKQQKLQELKAEKAKTRFEARKLRLEQDKRQRELKHQQAAEARRAKMNSTDGDNAKSAVAAALARVKAKKQATTDTSTTNDAIAVDTENSIAEQQQSQVAAAVARAKAKRLAKQSQTEQAPEILEKIENEPKNTKSNNPSQDSKLQTDSNSETTAEAHHTVQPNTVDAVAATLSREEKIKLVIGKAKQKAETTQSPLTEPADAVTTSIASNKQHADDRAQRIAAAIAKAKAKKQQTEKQ